MDSKGEGRLERATTLIYTLAFLFLLLPAVDLVLNTWPMQPGIVSWRYAAVGLASGFTLTPFLGLLIALLTALYFGHRRVQIAVGVIAAVVGLVTVVASMAFVLDVLQVRRSVAPEGRWTFDAGAGRAFFKHVAGLIFLGMTSYVAFATLAPASGRRARTPLVVRSPATPDQTG